MADIFLKIINMSISAGWIVLVVLLLRLLLKKAPKWINGILWGIVGLRLIMPFSLESIFSLIPSNETISKAPDSPRPYFESGVTIIDNQVNDYLGGHYYEGVTRPAGHFADITTILAIVWIVGIVVLLAYTIISYLKLKNKIGTAVLLRDNIYQSENVVSPFVLGIIKPKIYLPFNVNEQDMEHVIAHENAHISRKDHLWKPFGFLILTLHWFNPLMWLSYILLCRDIELACDEKVVKEFDNEQKADYSQALLTCSINRRIIAACPLAFGEIGVKNRVKSILNYKKPAFWVIAVAIIAVAVFAVCFLTNPVSAEPDKNVIDLDVTTELSDEQTPTGEKTPEDNKEPEKVEKTPEQSDPTVTPPTDKGQNEAKEAWEKSLAYSNFNSDNSHQNSSNGENSIEYLIGAALLNSNGNYILNGENLDHLAWVKTGYNKDYDGLYLGISLDSYHLSTDDKFIGICNDMVTKSYDGSIVKNNANIANEYVSISINGAPIKIKSVVMGKGNGHQDYYFVLDKNIDKSNIKEIIFKIEKTPENNEEDISDAAIEKVIKDKGIQGLSKKQYVQYLSKHYKNADFEDDQALMDYIGTTQEFTEKYITKNSKIIGIKKNLRENFYTVYFEDKNKDLVMNMIEKLSKDEKVLFIQPNFRYYLD